MPLIVSPIRVLVVEDETFTRMDVVEMLREAGFDILEATNADEAIQILERNSDIRLMFTDIDMPRLDEWCEIGGGCQESLAADKDHRNIRTFQSANWGSSGRRPVYLQTLPSRATH